MNSKNENQNSIFLILRSIFFESTFGIELMNNEGVIVDANESLLTLLGIENLNDVLGKSVWEQFIMTERDIASVKLKKRVSLTTKVNSSGKAVDFNQDKSFDLHIIPIITNLSEFNGYIVQVFDITEKINAKESLEELNKKYEELEKRYFFSLKNQDESEKLKSAILQNVPDLMFINNNDMVYLDYFVSKKSMLYIQPEKFINKSISEVFPPDISERFVQELKTAAETGEIQLFEYDLIIENMKCYFEARVIRIDEDKIMTLIRDITKLKTSREILRKSEAKLKMVFENTSEHYIILDLDKKIIGYNKNANSFFAALYGGELREGELISKYLKGDAYKDFVKNFDISSKGELSITNRKYELEGKVIWYEYRYIPLIDYIGALKGVFLSGTNITSRKKAEESVLDKTILLEKSNQSKDILFSLIAHDLKSPFNGLIGLSEVLSANIDYLTKNEIKEISLEIHNSVNNINILLDNLLEWSKIQRGIIKYEAGTFILHDLVEGVIKLCQTHSAKKNIRVENQIPQNILIEYDSRSLEIVARNLLTNAIKFSSPGSTVVINYSDDNKYNIIRVCDSGVGMTQEELLGLFNYKEIRSRMGTAGEKGTGLGLILSKEHIEMTGGKLLVESAVGEGSTFIIKLPKKII